MTTRYFHWDAVDDCVMHETDGAGATTVEYTHEPGRFGPLLSENRSGTESYHHYDALGSTTLLSDTSGNTTDTFAYDAWGLDIARTGTTPTPYKWVGRWGYQYDTPTGGYNVRARICGPSLGRWASLDPIGFRGGSLNQYSYVRSRPIIHVDPEGLQASLPEPVNPGPISITSRPPEPLGSAAWDPSAAGGFDIDINYFDLTIQLDFEQPPDLPQTTLSWSYSYGGAGIPGIPRSGRLTVPFSIPIPHFYPWVPPSPAPPIFQQIPNNPPFWPDPYPPYYPPYYQPLRPGTFFPSSGQLSPITGMPR